MTELLAPWLTALDGLRDLRWGPLGPVDLLVGLLVIGSVLGALRRGSGPLAALGSGIVALVGCWLVLTVLAAWAPPSLTQVVSESALAHHVRLPTEVVRAVGARLQDVMGARG